MGRAMDEREAWEGEVLRTMLLGGWCKWRQEGVPGERGGVRREEGGGGDRGGMG